MRTDAEPGRWNQDFKIHDDYNNINKIQIKHNLESTDVQYDGDKQI